jgi:hypothetical protein
MYIPCSQYVHTELVPFNRLPHGTSQESNTIVVLHDVFEAPSYWCGFMSSASSLTTTVTDTDLEVMFLSAMLVLALSRMTGLELVIPSYHPFLFSSVKETIWSELKSIEFGNVAMEEEEASDMVAWLVGMVDLERLLLRRLIMGSLDSSR